MRSSQHTSQSPHTKEKASTRFIEQLLELHPDQQLRFHWEEDDLPDFHTEDTVYRVTKTIVKTTNNGEESYFNIFLGSDHVRSTEDPVLKLTVSRPVPHKRRRTRPDAEWDTIWVYARTGTDRHGTAMWNQHLNDNPEGVTIVSDVERCSECGRPL